MIEREQSRLFNLKMRIIKYLIDNRLEFSHKFTIEDLRDNKNLFLREVDFSYLDKSDWFENHEKFYICNEIIKDDYESIKEKYIQKQDYEGLKKELFEAYEQIQLASKQKGYKRLNEILSTQVDNAFNLWKMTLVEYPEYYMENSGMYPSNKEFFNHIHMIEELCKLLSQPQSYSKLGDINLNQKMQFVVFTNRWGHDDHYEIARSYDGWIFYGMYQTADITNCEKDGSGALVDALEHDSINYPKDLSFAFEHLWEEADKKEMSTNELSSYISDLADWISITEKAKPKFLADMGIM